MKDWKIGAKFGAAMGVALALLFMVTWIYHATLGKVNDDFNALLQNEVRIGDLTREADSLMLQCRRNEKDFLLRKDLKYQEKFTDSVNRLTATAADIASLARQHGHEQIGAEAETIGRLGKTYQASFNKLVAEMEKIGLDHNSGLQGHFRDQVHNLGKDLGEHQVDDLYTDLLFMRRWEKDFILTGKEKYRERLKTAIATLGADLERNSCTPQAKKTMQAALASYGTAYDQLQQVLGNPTAKEKHYQEMRTQAHVMEDTIKSVLIPKALELLLEIRKHEKDYLMRRDLKYVTKLEKTVAELLGKAENSPADREHVESVRGQLAAYQQSFLQLVAADQLIDTELETLRSTVHQIEPAVEKILQTVEQVVANKTTVTEKEADHRAKISLFLALFTAVVGAFMAFRVVRSITDPIKEAVGFAETMAQGDFTRNLRVDRRDEIGTLTDALNRMRDSLAAMIGDINQGVLTLESSASELTSVAGEMSDAARNSGSKASSVAAAAEQMSSNMNTVAAAMEESSTNIDSVASATEEMNINISSIAANTDEARKRTTLAVGRSEQASDQVNTLGRAAEEISLVIETIAAISDKTNLLALNATIEAARAGVAGKGFAVVANEIKELSHQTANATRDIAEKLKAIQSSTDQTVGDITEVSTAIHQIDMIVGEIAEAVAQQKGATGEITDSIGQTALGIQEVNENVGQASQATGLVAREINEVNASTTEITNSAAQVSSAATALNRLSTQLKEMTNKFRV